ncbi:hypothetical protein HYPSUDRAFT_615756 [Hypholoma sublateritium FD-334 SS-4]|uniref:Uncharacterized protein n=1 Tax=Hypholoma sublateritium (strain FD-334 SS-4) TaxID=945553 RepID=A0A0D2QAS3_HYPSF|nr:hypothetical protein HYPSUDRAFT_615756 [Hypholoma sublateritium FD-334 SS-4]
MKPQLLAWCIGASRAPAQGAESFQERSSRNYLVFWKWSQIAENVVRSMECSRRFPLTIAHHCMIFISDKNHSCRRTLHCIWYVFSRSRHR